MKEKKVKARVTREIKPTKAVENDFYRELKRFSDKVNNSVYYWSKATFNKNFNKNVAKQLQFNFNELRDFWEREAKEFGEKYSKKFTSYIERYVKSKFNVENKDFDFNKTSKLEKNELTAMYERNLNLIKTMPSDIIANYESVFLNNVNNFDREALYKHFKNISGISARRAKTIARDQTQKAVTSYQMARAEALGFEYYVWRTSQDERVSTGKGGHKVLNGRIYKYNEPTAVIDSYGNVGHCSQRVNCRCVPLSVYLQQDEKLVKVRDSVNGDYYKIVKK